MTYKAVDRHNMIEGSVSRDEELGLVTSEGKNC